MVLSYMHIYIYIQCFCLVCSFFCLYVYLQCLFCGLYVVFFVLIEDQFCIIIFASIMQSLSCSVCIICMQSLYLICIVVFVSCMCVVFVSYIYISSVLSLVCLQSVFWVFYLCFVQVVCMLYLCCICFLVRMYCSYFVVVLSSCMFSLCKVNVTRKLI